MIPHLERIRAILFDWDGTLLDSAHATFTAFQKTLEAEGKTITPEVFARLYSPNWQTLYQAFGLGPEAHPRLALTWAHHFQVEKKRLVVGARRLLHTLRARGKLRGLVSASVEAAVLPELLRRRLIRFFDVIVTSDHVVRTKPAPDLLERALFKLGCVASEAIYVGDAPEDIKMAQTLAVQTVGVIGPYPLAKQLRAAEPDILCHARDLASLFELSRGQVRITGRVVQGLGRGKVLGFPTLNLESRPRIPYGIYAVEAVLDGRRYRGVLHWGPKPVFQEKTPSLELHLLKFEGAKVDALEVQPRYYLRPIFDFPSPDDLRSQIQQDCEKAQRLLFQR